MGPTIVVENAHAALLQWDAFVRGVQAREKVLWFDGASRASVLQLSPGATLQSHAHHHETHHIWVANGSCVIDGHRVQTGSYVFVPAGARHGAKAGMHGCILFYVVTPAQGGDHADEESVVRGRTKTHAAGAR